MFSFRDILKEFEDNNRPLEQKTILAEYEKKIRIIEERKKYEVLVSFSLNTLNLSSPSPSSIFQTNGAYFQPFYSYTHP